MGDTTSIVSVDDGYSHTKLFTADFLDGRMGSVRTAIHQTSIREGYAGISDISGSSAGWYETEGRRYTVASNVVGEQTRFDGYHGSDLNRVAIHHAINMAGLGGQAFDLVCGLPVGSFYKDGEKNVALIEQKKESLKIPVHVHAAAGKIATTFAGISVLSQAISAYADFLLDDTLNDRIGSSHRIAVVDVGGRTTDVATLLDGKKIDHAHSGTQNIGVLDVQARLVTTIGKHFDFSETLPNGAYDQALRTGSIRIFGKDEDVSDLVKEAVHEVAGRIERTLQRYLASGASFDKVVIVGGGAEVFPDLKARFRNAETPDDPALANARGAWKLATLRRFASEKQAA